jgi:hypothetical protein
MRQPAKKAIKNFVLLCSTNEEYERKLVSLERAVKSPEWSTVIEILWTIKNDMASELLASAKLTQLEANEKDTVQRVYHEVNEIIDFLTMPMKWVSKKGLLVRALGRVGKGAQNGRGS